MLDTEQIKGKALELARNALGPEIKDVIVEQRPDFEGRTSLRVTVLIKSRWSADPPGNKLNDLSRRLNAFLTENDDPRFAYTHYMTPREFSASNAGRKPTANRRRAAS